MAKKLLKYDRSYQLGDGTTLVTADKYFDRIQMDGCTLVSFQVNFNTSTGASTTGVGTLYIQGSNHDEPTDAAAGTNEWETLDVVFPRNVTSGAGQAAVSLSNVAYRWVRLYYDFILGSGAMAVRVVCKDA